jgi:hypothetical protein
MSHREKWKYFEDNKDKTWVCRKCKAEDTPRRSLPFDGTYIICPCGQILTKRTNGGQSDPFNWEIKS